MLEPHVVAYTSAPSQEQRSAAAASLSGLFSRKQATALELVQALQDWLISEDGGKRAMGTRLLADVVGSAAGSMSPGDVHHLTEFLAARLTDWPCVEQAALACTALLQCFRSAAGAGGAAPAHKGDALTVLRTAVTGLAPQLQALAQPQRSAGLRLLILAIQDWGPDSLRAAQAAGGDAVGGLNLVEAVIAAVDGEKDPRCLLASFELLQTVVRVYHTPGVSPAQLSAQAEEVVEVLSCYFPVSFTPPKNDPYKITRNDLARGLEACMAASPFLACWVLPLVLEKLSSTYRPAKEDALSALETCCCSYGYDAMQPHLPAVWSALRNEIVIAPSAFGVVGGEELQTKRALAAKASFCLAHIMASMPQAEPTFQDLVTRDVCVQELLSLIDASGSNEGGSVRRGSDPDRPDRVVQCTGVLLGAVCGGSTSVCQRVLSAIVSRIVGMLPGTGDSTLHMEAVEGLGAVTKSKTWASTKVLYCLMVVRGVLRGVATAVSAIAQFSPSATTELCAQYCSLLAPGFVSTLVGALTDAMDGVAPACLGTTMEVDAADNEESDTETAPQVLLASIALWHELLSLHSALSIPTHTHLEAHGATPTATPGSPPTPPPPAHTAPANAAGILSSTQLARCVHALTRWVLVADVQGSSAHTAGGSSQGVGGGADEEVLPEGVVSPAPARVQWKEPQCAHEEALAALQLVLRLIEQQQQQQKDQQGSGNAGRSEELGLQGGGLGVNEVGSMAVLSTCTSEHQYLLQQLCTALLGPAVLMQGSGSVGGHVNGGGGGGGAAAQVLGSGTTEQQQQQLQAPPPAGVRARALRACHALSRSSVVLALALQAQLPPLLLGLLRCQAARSKATSAAERGAAMMWAAVVQELLHLLGQQLGPTWPQPLPTHHTHTLTTFLCTLLELPLDTAILSPAAAAAAAATPSTSTTDPTHVLSVNMDHTHAVNLSQQQKAAAAGAARVLPALCTLCASLTACCGADTQVGIALAACEAVEHASSTLQNMRNVHSAAAAPGAAGEQGAAGVGGAGVGGGAASQGAVVRACAACAAITGLQASMLVGAQSVLQLVDALCELATWQPVTGQAHSAGAGELPAGVLLAALCCSASTSLASLVNKWPGGPEELESVACRVLDRWGLLQCLSSDAGNAGASPHTYDDGSTWHALAWLTRALAMRGSPRASALTQHVVQRLVSLGFAEHPHAAPATATTAAATAGTAEAMAVDNPAHIQPLASGTLSVTQEADSQLQSHTHSEHTVHSKASRALADAGAAFFRTTTAGSTGGDATPAWHHARSKVLWQQRTLTSCITPLLSALEHTTPSSRSATLPPYNTTPTPINSTSTSTSAAPTSQSNNPAATSVSARAALLLALSSVLGCAPLAMLRNEASRLVAPLLCALSEVPACGAAAAAPAAPSSVQQGRGATPCGGGNKTQPQGVASGLGMVEGQQGADEELQGEVNVCLEGGVRVLEQLYLRDTQMRALLEEHVEQLVGCVALLIGFQGWQAVREASLRCAMLLLEMPYHLLHPHRLLVIRAVTRALDDNKRSVRQLAVKCRRQWVAR